MTLLRRLGTARYQLGWPGFIEHVLAALARRLLDPFAIPSYAQFGEDRLLDACLGGRTRGFYVDVGCNDPVRYSNTWKLYLRGWTGIAVDANPELVARYRRLRPRDTALACVVSDANAPVRFYSCDDEPLISGVGRRTRGPWPRTEENARVSMREPRRLTEILDEHAAPSSIDLLSVDVEGHELEVLDSLDFERYRPLFILVELHDLDLAAPESDPVYRKLGALGYRLRAHAVVSALFSREAGDG